MTTAGPGTTLVGRYLLAERLASDLVDVTAWSAHDSVLNRTVRVSLVTGEHVAEAIDSARRAALVADPRLTRVLDVGTDDGVAYVITEPLRASRCPRSSRAGSWTPSRPAPSSARRRRRSRSPDDAASTTWHCARRPSGSTATASS